MVKLKRNSEFVEVEPADSSKMLPTSRQSQECPEACWGDSRYFAHSLAKKGRKIQVFVKILEIDTGIRMDRSKTIGSISIKNADGLLMCAHSGYSTGAKREDVCLDTEKWNSLTLNHLAKQVGFRFPGSIRDTTGGPILDQHRGRAHAGHVEVLLACWYVVETTRQYFDLVNGPEERVITQIRKLRGAALGDKRTAFLTIDSEPCRTCLQFLNKVSQYTGIIFMVIGSKGIGPIQVRIDGRRREDVVGDVFSDSDDETMAEESSTEREVMEPPNIAFDSTTTPKATTPVLRRPHSSWKIEPWTPEDPDELLSHYKKKTPVYEFPGYSRAPRPDAETSRELETNYSPTLSPCASGSNGSLREWEHLGDDLLICSTGGTSSSQKYDFSKENQSNRYDPFPANPDNLQNDRAIEIDYVDGEMFANSARRTANIEKIERRNEVSDSRLSPYRSYEQASSSEANSVPTRGMPQLQKFRYDANIDIDESLFRRKYSILRSKHQN